MSNRNVKVHFKHVVDAFTEALNELTFRLQKLSQDLAYFTYRENIYYSSTLDSMDVISGPESH